MTRNPADQPSSHSRESGDPGRLAHNRACSFWVPACARTSGFRGVLGRAGLVLALLACALVPAAAQQTQSQNQPANQPPKPAQIDRNGVLILIRSTLLALDHANKTGNYTVLRDLAAPGFQVNTAARLGEIFVGHRRDNLDLSGVAAIEPQLSVLPQIEANGMMRMAGFFPSIPTQVNFELTFAPIGGQWRLFGISVSLGQAAPAAPSAPDPPPTPPAPPSGAAAQPKPPPKAPAPARLPAPPKQP